MFSIEKSIRIGNTPTPDIGLLLNDSFRNILSKNGLCAGMFCICDEDCSDTVLLASFNIPSSPFTGSKKGALKSFIRECLNIHPVPHAHSIARSDLWSEIASLVDVITWQKRVVFLPFYARDNCFVVLCFSDSHNILKLESPVITDLLALVDLVAFFLNAERNQKHIEIMGLYVKEVGHDMASSVQTIISKLKNVSRGIIQGPAAIEKIKEAEDEIMSAYRIADTLGITVDPNYNLGGGEDFDAVAASKAVIQRCLSEAQERHIEFKEEFPEEPLLLWGDEKAIQSAMTQYLMNAIKYAKGSSYIAVRIREKKHDVEFSVTDFGAPLEEEEKMHMWEFGFRGRRALELHVNGSGIGLYTVRKVVQAHGGTVGARNSRDDNLVTFFFTLPKRDIMKKSALYVHKVT